MTQPTAFSPDAHQGRAWESARQQARIPQRRSSFDEVREELALRDFVARLAYALDHGDVDQIVRSFAEDCVVHNLGGSYAGVEELRGYYERLLRDIPRRQHLFSNVLVRLSDGLNEGWITAYYQATLQSVDQPPQVKTGVIIDHVVKAGGEWKIRGRSVGLDTVTGVVSVPGD